MRCPDRSVEAVGHGTVRLVDGMKLIVPAIGFRPDDAAHVEIARIGEAADQLRKRRVEPVDHHARDLALDVAVLDAARLHRQPDPLALVGQGFVVAVAERQDVAGERFDVPQNPVVTGDGRVEEPLEGRQDVLRGRERRVVVAEH